MTALPAYDHTDEASWSFEGLQRLIDITEQMLESARAGTWDGLARLEQEQRRLAEEIFAEAPPEPEAGIIAQRLEFLLELNARVTDLIRARRRQTAEQLLGLQAGRRAKAAYSE
jgi:hypothetical protein